MINGLTHHAAIAESFADTFEASFQPNNTPAHARLQQQFQLLYGSYCGDTFDIESAVKVELVDPAIRNLKLGRAAGPDAICAEHLLYSHPLLCVLLSLLFCLIFKYNYVPASFGIGMIIPLLKADNCDFTVADIYRAISVSSYVSKVFELCLSSMFDEWLGSDELQFGFKKGRGCRDAIYTLRGIVNHINTNGSTAVLCALEFGCIQSI